MHIRIVDVSAEGGRASYRLAYSSPLRKYLLRDTFFVQYDGRVETAGIHQSVLVIPVVSMMAPVAWALGADLEVDMLDETYLRSLGRIREVLTGWYPRFSTSGDIDVGSVVRNQFGGTRTCLLFSGGLDAFTSYTRHRDEKPDLVSVWCHDPRLHEEEKWACVKAAARWLSERDGVASLQVKSNLTSINDRLLNHVLGLSGSWYGQVAHGLLLLSLCAPITAVRDIGRVRIGSGNPQNKLSPWGSHPSIDNNVSWADVAATHDALELSRQEKIRYMSAVDRECLTKLKVCHTYPQNCGKCEKCFRTIAGLCVEGVDPRECGLNADNKTFDNIKRSILAGKMPSHGGGEQVEWEGIQRHIPVETGPDMIGSREFFTWLKGYDFSRHRINRPRRNRWVRWLEFLRFSHSIRSGRVTREHLRYLHYWTVCRLHLVLYHGRRVLAGKLGFLPPPA
jgi:hypothetical protein